MFSLVITIISIALVTVLAIAAIIYTGIAFTNAGASARVSQTVQEGAQIATAIQVYRVYEGALPSGTSEEISQELINKKYLSIVPAGDWVFKQEMAVHEGVDEQLCRKVNAKLGIATVPLCSDDSIKSLTVCCAVD